MAFLVCWQFSKMRSNSKQGKHMKNENTYNGWTNYATWRINLEMFDGYNPIDEHSND